MQKPKAKASWMDHPGKSELRVPHYARNQQSINVTALCPLLREFLLFHQMVQESKRI